MTTANNVRCLDGNKSWTQRFLGETGTAVDGGIALGNRRQWRIRCGRPPSFKVWRGIQGRDRAPGLNEPSEFIPSARTEVRSPVGDAVSPSMQTPSHRTGSTTFGRGSTGGRTMIDRVAFSPLSASFNLRSDVRPCCHAESWRAGADCPGPFDKDLPVRNIEVLNQPLLWLERLTFDAAIDWIIAGLRAAAPSWLRRYGWRPCYVIAEAEPILVERSWLGETRKANLAGVASEALPCAVCIRSSEVFLTTVNLPVEARPALREAVRHRLQDASPIPLAEIEFAVGESAPTREGRLIAEVAIVRKQTIADAMNSGAGRSVSMIGAGLYDDGGFRFLFGEAVSPESDWRAFAPVVAVLTGAVAFLTGLDIYVDRRLYAFSAYETQLLDVLKAEREKFSILDGLTQDAGARENALFALPELGRVAALLPESVWIEEARITSTALEVSGFARRATQWPAELDPAIAASDRPETDRYSFRLDVSPQ